MNIKQIGLIAVLSLALIGVVTAFVIQPVLTAEAQGTTEGPCKSCDTWGEVKSCYSSTPHSCCNCHKNFTQE